MSSSNQGPWKSRILTADTNSQYRPWSPPEVTNDKSGGAGQAFDRSGGGQSAVDQVAEKSFQKGYLKGREEAQAESRQQLGSLVSELSNACKRMDETIVSDLTDLAIRIASEVVRGEMVLSESHIVRVVESSLEEFQSETRDLRIRVHPEDARILRENLNLPDEVTGVEFIEDGNLDRGACLAETRFSRMDAGVEARLRSVVAGMLEKE